MAWPLTAIVAAVAATRYLLNAQSSVKKETLMESQLPLTRCSAFLLPPPAAQPPARLNRPPCRRRQRRSEAERGGENIRFGVWNRKEICGIKSSGRSRLEEKICHLSPISAPTLETGLVGQFRYVVEKSIHFILTSDASRESRRRWFSCSCA